MSFMNIPYGLGSTPIPLASFISIWKVQANDSYQITKGKGFEVPGLFITYEGKGILTQDEQHYELHAGTYFFVRDGIAATYRCQGNDWKFYFLDFNSMDAVHALHLPVQKVVSTGKAADAIQHCERIIDLLIAEPFGYAYSTNIILQEVMLLFAKEHSAALPARHTELNKIMIYIHRNLDKVIRVDELIDQSGMSRTTFFSRFRSLTGLSPTEYMLNLKLESAKVSLETTSLSVKEIAAYLQFYDEFHFSKLFKRKFGLSPSAFRRLT
ncbi:helix-turn-helix domain-containing protein [Paenibacillus chondroitinus]|uniref:Helix-turn-helix domain-containing protein n=1 Tax=Paenibacillus chondroitinus TaxID=59842 RepID=A0ABU6DBX0_9BACL|nr:MULTISPECIES: AraC family transcriptional regulator [Paenibacillus]MCY9656798.1 AraC family transcriptional regulator [Paenibacillus anseongense]MEB4794448.1 helix-turn-helix domain-containing protein [Paenibacillus chondroitinus]